MENYSTEQTTASQPAVSYMKAMGVILFLIRVGSKVILRFVG